MMHKATSTMLTITITIWHSHQHTESLTKLHTHILYTAATSTYQGRSSARCITFH